MFRMLIGPDFTLTKRHLGLILAAAGIFLLVALLVMELRSEQAGEFGTAQKLAVLIGVLSTGVGLTLLPLGNRPA